MADGGEFGGVQAEAPVGQLVGDAGQRGGVVGAVRLADALDQAGAEPTAVGHVDQLVLDRGGAGVENEYAGGVRHDCCSFASSAAACWAWMAVMATVLTMSWTNAPRDRSFTGLRRPWSTG